MPTALCTAALLALGACADVRHADDGDDGQPDGDGSSDGADPAPQVEPDEFEPPPPPLALPDDALVAAADQVRAIVASTTFTHSVLIENAATGQLVVESNADDLLKPASNTKLYTTAAAIEILGADHGLTTRVAADAAPDADGVIAGDLHIVLEHDFTLSSDLYDGPRQPLDRIAQALARLGVVRVDGTVHVSGESVFEGNAIGILDVAAERAETTDAAAAALADAGIAAGAVAPSPTLEVPEGAALLLEHAPISLVAASSPLNTDSNNEFADLLIRHLGWRMEGDSSAEAGARAVIEWLASTGVPTEGIELHDGSGLSHDNRVSARATVGLLRAMDGSPVGAAWGRTLAIAGVRGTLGNRMLGEDTVGRVFGKSGTLRDTITLSGTVENRHDGQRYLFSVLWNAVDDAASARDLADRIVEVVAANLRGGPARLPAPQLHIARATGTAGVIELGWSEVDGADGYLVWFSEDGLTWPREAARYVRGNRFLAGDLSEARAAHVRVSARAVDGLESDPSAAYAATASGERAAVLLVDGNDVWSSPAAENALGRHHEFLSSLAAATGRAVDSAHHGAVERGDVDLAGYDVVVWAAGEESTMTEALSPAERELLAGHVGAGRALLLSSAEVVWALADQGDADEQAFVADVLGAVYVGDDAGTYEAEGAGGEQAGDFAALPAMSFLAPDGMDILFPDVLAPGEGGVELLRYVGAEGAAAVGHAAPTGRRVVVTGFPIEAMPSAAARAALLEAALRFLEP